MLHYKPNTVTVTPKVAVKSGKQITGYTTAATFSVSGMLVEIEPGVAFENYGLNASFPAYFMCDVSDGALIEIGDSFTLLGKTYRVHAGPMLENAEPITSYAYFVVSRDS